MSVIANMLLKNIPRNNALLLSPLSCRLFNTSKIQYLYVPAALGIDGYLSARKKIKEQFVNYTDKFKTKMTEFVNDQKNMVFTEDLKNMVHIAEPVDLPLILDMVKKFNTQNTEYRFGSFVFGPVVMRMFHFLDAPDDALKCFEEPANKGFFDQQVSYQLLLDLLYNHARYEDMRRVFAAVQQCQVNMTRFPKYSVVLVFAACYKQNTAESMEYAKRLWSEMTSTGTQPLRRAASFFAGLALKQGAPHIALEVISMQTSHYVTIRNIKAEALAASARPDEAVATLRSVLDIDSPAQRDRHTFFAATVEAVRRAAAASPDRGVQEEFASVERALRERNLISTQTLDELLCSEITVKARPSAPGRWPEQRPRQQRHWTV